MRKRQRKTISSSKQVAKKSTSNTRKKARNSKSKLTALNSEYVDYVIYAHGKYLGDDAWKQINKPKEFIVPDYVTICMYSKPGRTLIGNLETLKYMCKNEIPIHKKYTSGANCDNMLYIGQNYNDLTSEQKQTYGPNMGIYLCSEKKWIYSIGADVSTDLITMIDIIQNYHTNTLKKVRIHIHTCTGFEKGAVGLKELEHIDNVFSKIINDFENMNISSRKTQKNKTSRKKSSSKKHMDTK